MMTDNLFATLEQGATLLTANRRLARHLRQAFDTHQRRHGRVVWATADILPLSAWLERCWNEVLDTAGQTEFPALLNSHQELALWERIIANSPEGKGLLRIPAAAQEAQEAWMLLRQWRISLDDMRPPLNDDAHAFRRWARHFAKLCSASAWMDRGSLMDFAAQQINTGALKAPRHVLLAGFDELTPQQQALIAALRAADVIVDELPPPALTGAVMRIGLADAEAEIRVAARWVRDLLERGAGSIGVVIHDLGAVREKVVRIFNDTLLPGAVMPGGDDDIPLYNISLGQPLQDQPVVHAALLILDMAQGRLPLEKAGSLLRSPFLAGAEQEMTRRARLDARLRRVGEPTVSVETLRRHALGGGENGVCPQLAAALDRWLEVVRSLPKRQTPSAWAADFARLLAAIGWPGERSLDSREYQAVMAWRELLADYAQLDVVVTRQGMGDALSRLRQMTGSILFQPQGADAPVQILGVLEAAGMQFDHLWVMGLHDEVWPASPRPNPFLPHELQRRHGLPHASAERELLFARRLTDRLLAAAPRVIASYPKQDGDRERRPSPLIAGLPETPPDQLSLARHDSWMNVIHAAQTIEERDDHQAPTLAAGTSVSGGTGVLKQQAACPFRAFAEHRLGAKPLPVADVGLSPSERGQLLHAALERVWQRLRRHEDLCRASPEEVREIVAEAVAAAIDGMAQKRRSTFTAKFKVLEEDRLLRLITDWLELEKRRAAFTVLELEQQHVMHVGGLMLSTRIDRIDRLPDGRQVIVDYKTSDANIGGWFGDRPDEPQLPLYCAYNGESVAGLAFAQLRPGSSAFKGLTQNAHVMPGVKALAETKYGRAFAWDELVGEWQKTLQRLADEFRAGRAEVDPKKPPQTCQFCALPALCRINEHDGLGMTEVEEGEGEDSE
ncbi:MAG: PD-(D/E)XK nuclease family protein [Gammaproteobacteria bacterium]|nr:PD-(D/E)XK nuclease family protein [Gammaproteobacteria bacterium]